MGLILGWTCPGRAAAFEARDTGWEGTSELLSLAREKLGAERVVPLAALDYSALTPKDAVLVLHPTVDLDYDELSAFLASGGRVAVLDDHGSSPSFLSRYRIHRVPAPLRPARALRGNPNLAFAVPAVQSVAGREQNRHPVVAEVDVLLTNHPAALTHPDLTPVLRVAALGEPDAVLAVTGVIAGRGRLFVMADPSSVINLMLRYPGNRAFAQGLVHYLVEDDGWGKRQGTIYYLSNRFDQVGHYGGRDSFRTRLADAFDGARQAVRNLHEHGLPDTVALLLAGLGCLSLLVWGMTYSVRRYRGRPPRFASPVPLLAQGGLPGRASVLAASTTDPALVLDELDSLLREELSARAGLPPTAAPESSLSVLIGNDRRLLEKARKLLQAGRLARAAVLGRRPSRVRPGQVAEHARELRALLLALDSASPPGPGVARLGPEAIARP